MPPRRKAAKKNVRKPKAKAQTPPPEPEVVPDVEPETEPEVEPEPAAFSASTPSATDPQSAANEPATDASADRGTVAAPVPAVTETLAGEAETLTTEVKPDSADGTVAEESKETAASSGALTQTAAATETLESATATDPAGDGCGDGIGASDSDKKKTKKVTIVKKVIKKKIVKKLVPKSCSAAKEEPKVVEESEKPKEEISHVVSETRREEEEKKNEETREVVPETIKEENKEEVVEMDTTTKEEVVPETIKEENKEEVVETDTTTKEEEKKEEVVGMDIGTTKEEEEKMKEEDMVMETESKKGEEKKDEDAVMEAETIIEEAKKEEIAEVEAATTKEANKEEVALETSKEEKEAGISEKKSKKRTEIFVGGLDRDAKEEDLRKVFGKAGEIVEVRMIMDTQSGKNKGYAFLRYADANQAKKAVADFEKVEVCGKLCGASAIKGNDTLYLGNIDKKWKKEDLMKLLQEIGVEKIEAVTLISDPNKADSNRGFAFLELETTKDAQNAFKKLQQKDAFGKGLNVKISWAEPLDDPDEKEIKKVKSVYAEGIPSSWSEENLRESFKKFGEIERIVLSRDIISSKRKDFAFVNYTTREAALLCIESFNKEELTDNGSKVNIEVSLAKPVQKGKQNKGRSNYSDKAIMKEKPKTVQRDTKPNNSFSALNTARGVRTYTDGTRSSTNHELLHVLREQATWKHGNIGYSGGPSMQGPSVHDYPRAVGGKRPFSSMGEEAFYSDPRGYPRPRPDSIPAAAAPRYGSLPHGMPGPSRPYYHQRQDPGFAAGPYYGTTDYSAPRQMRPGAPPPRPPYGGSSSYYPRQGF